MLNPLRSASVRPFQVESHTAAPTAPSRPRPRIVRTSQRWRWLAVIGALVPAAILAAVSAFLFTSQTAGSAAGGSSEQPPPDVSGAVNGNDTAASMLPRVTLAATISMSSSATPSPSSTSTQSASSSASNSASASVSPSLSVSPSPSVMPSASAVPCRDQNLWPFSDTSYWNHPLGDGAQFSPANLFAGLRKGEEAPYAMQSDPDWFIVPTAADPILPWVNQGFWGAPAAAYCNYTGPLVPGGIRFPNNLIVNNFGNNNGAAILQQDNRTLLLIQPIYHCQAGAPVTALANTPGGMTADIRGNGIGGGHGGSGLSSFGGTIRLGELLPAAPPMRHALKLEFFAAQYFYLPRPCNRTLCYRWPATNCDGYVCSTPGAYNGTNPKLTPGALLAVPPALAVALNASLGTLPARKLLAALSTYGGYVVDDTFWNATSICTEEGVATEFQAAYGFPFTVTSKSTGAAAAWYADQLALFRALQIVDNNSPTSVGGGGVPLAASPPPFCNYTSST